MNLDSISQQIMPYSKANSSSLPNIRFPKSSYEGVAEWIDVKSHPFVCLALKITLKKELAKEIKVYLSLYFL